MSKRNNAGIPPRKRNEQISRKRIVAMWLTGIGLMVGWLTFGAIALTVGMVVYLSIKAPRVLWDGQVGMLFAYFTIPVGSAFGLGFGLLTAILSLWIPRAIDWISLLSSIGLIVFVSIVCIIEAASEGFGEMLMSIACGMAFAGCPSIILAVCSIVLLKLYQTRERKARL